MFVSGLWGCACCAGVHRHWLLRRCFYFKHLTTCVYAGMFDQTVLSPCQCKEHLCSGRLFCRAVNTESRPQEVQLKVKGTFSRAYRTSRLFPLQLVPFNCRDHWRPKMKCPSCNHTILGKTAKFCSECGQKISVQPANTQGTLIHLYMWVKHDIFTCRIWLMRSKKFIKVWLCCFCWYSNGE